MRAAFEWFRANQMNSLVVFLVALLVLVQSAVAQEGTPDDPTANHKTVSFQPVEVWLSL